MPRAAIIETNIDQLVAEVRDAQAALRDVETRVVELERHVTEARETARVRRLELGRLLAKARKAWPERGPRAKGWGEFLARAGLDDSTAWRYIQLAETSPVHGSSSPGGARDFTQQGDMRETSDGPPGQDVPPPGDADAPPAPASEPPKPDRDTWCTPLWIAEAIGRWDLDPCSNERSHIQSANAFRLDRGEDGLELAYRANVANNDDLRVYVNPPYSDVMPWVQAYKHTRFCFLVKFDPSTRWCAELLAHTELVLFPKRTRIEFEPPPGVPGDGGNQFPHGLFFAHAEDASPEIRAACFEFHVPKAAA